jgi:hypothetical protein
LTFHSNDIFDSRGFIVPRVWRGPAAIGLVHDRTTTARTPDNLLFGFGRGRLRPERGFDEKLNFEKIVFSGAFCDQVNAVELVDATVLFYLSREQRCKFAATWFLKNILRPMQILKIPRPIPRGSNSGCFWPFQYECSTSPYLEVPGMSKSKTFCWL